MIEITIDGQRVEVEEGTTALEAARSLGIEIPTLCYHDGLPPDGNCRLCQVEVVERGRSSLVISCMYPIKGPVEIFTRTEKVRRARAFVIGLLLTRSPRSPVLLDLAAAYDVRPLDERFRQDDRVDLCIRCGRCVRACAELGNNCLDFVGRGWSKTVDTPFKEPSAACIGCGSCAQVCPTGAIRVTEKEGSRTIWGRTFALVACEQCGLTFAPQDQVDAVAGGLPVLCPRCRRLAEGRAIAAGLGAQEEKR